MFDKLRQCIVCKSEVKPYTGAYVSKGYIAHDGRRKSLNCYAQKQLVEQNIKENESKCVELIQKTATV
jgi:hypothetical protein